MTNKYLIQYEDWDNSFAKPRLKTKVKVANFTDKELEDFCSSKPHFTKVTLLQAKSISHNSVRDTVRK
jgi:hypothetical protein